MVDNTHINESNTADEIAALKKEIADLKNKKRSGSTGWIIFGYIFAVLGGPLGIAMGAHYAWWGKNYDSNTRKNGKIMLFLGVFFFMLWSGLTPR